MEYVCISYLYVCMLEMDFCSLPGGGGRPEWCGELGLFIPVPLLVLVEEEVGRGSRPTLRLWELQYNQV